MGVSNEIINFLKQKAAIQRIPLNANFELLPVCNLNCKMCYIRSTWSEVNNLGGLKTADEWLELAKELKEAGTLFLLLTGGEVFIYPEFKRLYIELYKMGFVLTINTNATMINEEVVEWLKDYPPKCVSISLYGSNDEAYEKLCGAKGMFTRVSHAIELLQTNNIKVECKTMLNPINKADLSNCWKYMKERKVFYEVAIYSFPDIRKISRGKQIRFTAKEAAECTFYRNKLMSSEDGYKEEIIKVLKKYEKTKDVPGQDVKGFSCTAANTSCWITWRGDMTPCALMTKPITKPFEVGFKNAWENMKKITDEITLSSKCSHCDKRQVCSVCPASALAETGSFDGTSEYHCEMTNTLLDEMYQYVKEHNIDLSLYDEKGELIKND